MSHIEPSPKPAELPLKADHFGRVFLTVVDGREVVVRETSGVALPLRGFARRLMQREALALGALEGLGSVPQCLSVDRDRLVRSYIEGTPMYEARPRDPQFFRLAMAELRRMHRRNVAHNDLAKEPNLLVTPDGRPAFIDFQLATVSSATRSRWFRLQAREDIRHLLKHKRSYCPDALTEREREILASPSVPSRFVRAVVKPVYLFVTRRLLGWADREGAPDRSRYP